LTDKGLQITGASPDGRLAEIVEIKDHPWFWLSVSSRVQNRGRQKPHPLFSKFIEAALKHAKGKSKKSPARPAKSKTGQARQPYSGIR